MDLISFAKINLIIALMYCINCIIFLKKEGRNIKSEAYFKVIWGYHLSTIYISDKQFFDTFYVGGGVLQFYHPCKQVKMVVCINGVMFSSQGINQAYLCSVWWATYPY